jgi:hypothetical protein
LRPTDRQRSPLPVSVADPMTPIRGTAASGAMRVNESTKDQSPMASLSPEVVARLRETLEHWVHGNGSESSALRDALRAAATEARERGVRAEALLVTLKTTWFEVGGSANTPHSSGSGHRRLDELVTACIKAYYA